MKQSTAFSFALSTIAFLAFCVPSYAQLPNTAKNPPSAKANASAKPSPAPKVEFKPLTIEEMTLGMALKSKLMIWDGDKFPDHPQWWLQPQKNCSITITKLESHSGRKCLQFHGEGAAFIGFGFNFPGWYPPDAVWDISNYKNLSFWIRFDAAPGKMPNRPNVHLTASGGKESDTAELETYDKDVLDGQWHEIVIPIKHLLKAEFDPTKCWEFDFGEWSQDSRTFDVYVDEIGVDNREE